MNKVYDTLEFNTITSLIKGYCVSQDAKTMIEELSPIKDIQELHKAQCFVQEAMRFIFKYGKIPLGYFQNISQILSKANKDGTLFGEDFIYILQQLQNVKEIQNYVDENGIEENILVDYVKELYVTKELMANIQRCIDPTGSVLDNASSELRKIRRSILSTEASIRSRITKIKSENKDLLSQETISSRNDHLVLPVKATHKNNVKGIVHALSASGQTMFIEPEAIVQINNQLVHLQEEERREVHRILTLLSKEVKAQYAILLNNQDILIYLDSVFAKAAYGVKTDSCVPSIRVDYSCLSLKKARHPLIDPNVVVSNDIVIKDGKKMLLISGSNTGGKTVVLKTAGLLSVMALSGLAIPCQQADVPLFDDIYVDLGDEQSIEQSLSTFSSHMKRLVEITKHVTSKSLVLLDEIGSGTDPQEGQSLAQAILKYLYQKQATTIASTHYSGLKQFSKQEDYIIVAAVEFDQENMRPTYRLLEGSVGNSYAIEISSKLGLLPKIIEDAIAIKESHLTESDRLLEKLQDELTTVQLQKDQLEQLSKETQSKIEKYDTLITTFKRQKETMLLEAKKEANTVLEESKKIVDDVVEELMKSNDLKPHVVIEAKRTLDVFKHSDTAQVQTIVSDHVFSIGDRVKVVSAQREGEVLSINKKGILTIDIGGLNLNAKPTEVQFIGKKLKPKKVQTNTRSLRKETRQGYEINVIGKRYEEAMLLVDKFLDDALVQNYTMIRIVHGMGTGVLRGGIRKMLDKNKEIVSYRDGGPNEGGLGATLVYFE